MSYQGEVMRYQPEVRACLPELYVLPEVKVGLPGVSAYKACSELHLSPPATMPWAGKPQAGVPLPTVGGHGQENKYMKSQLHATHVNHCCRHSEPPRNGLAGRAKNLLLYLAKHGSNFRAS